jgi:hypothetical protein
VRGSKKTTVACRDGSLNISEAVPVYLDFELPWRALKRGLDLQMT